MNIQEILHSLQGTTVFSSLDASGAYRAVRIEPSVEHVHHLLAHSACSSIYNAFWISQCWKCVQQDAGCSHEGGGQGFLNFIPGWYTDFQQVPCAHLGHLAKVVWAYAAAGIKIEPCKHKLFQSEVEYLGHKISKGGVLMIPEYEQKIKDWPVPKSGMEVATFLGVIIAPSSHNTLCWLTGRTGSRKLRSSCGTRR